MPIYTRCATGGKHAGGAAAPVRQPSARREGAPCALPACCEAPPGAAACRARSACTACARQAADRPLRSGSSARSPQHELARHAEVRPTPTRGSPARLRQRRRAARPHGQRRAGRRGRRAARPAGRRARLLVRKLLAGRLGGGAQLPAARASGSAPPRAAAHAPAGRPRGRPGHGGRAARRTLSAGRRGLTSIVHARVLAARARTRAPTRLLRLARCPSAGRAARPRQAAPQRARPPGRPRARGPAAAAAPARARGAALEARELGRARARLGGHTRDALRVRPRRGARARRRSALRRRPPPLSEPCGVAGVRPESAPGAPRRSRCSQNAVRARASARARLRRRRSCAPGTHRGAGRRARGGAHARRAWRGGARRSLRPSPSRAGSCTGRGAGAGAAVGITGTYGAARRCRHCACPGAHLASPRRGAGC